MAWIQSHDELRQHPKCKRLARTLGVSLPTAIGHLHLLWWWAQAYAPDGDLSGFDDAEIEDEAMWPGPKGEFYAALVAHGWLDAEGESRRLHDWDEHGGRLYRQREKDAERKRRQRGAASPGPVSQMSRASEDVTSNGHPTAVTREKRREEIEKRGEGDAATQPAAAAPIVDDLISVLRAKDTKETRAALTRIVEKYPGHDDLVYEAGRCVLWHDGSRRKVKSMAVAFGNWMKRAEDDGRTRRGQPNDTLNSQAMSRREAEIADAIDAIGGGE